MRTIYKCLKEGRRGQKCPIWLEHLLKGQTQFCYLKGSINEGPLFRSSLYLTSPCSPQNQSVSVFIYYSQFSVRYRSRLRLFFQMKRLRSVFYLDTRFVLIVTLSLVSLSLSWASLLGVCVCACQVLVLPSFYSRKTPSFS